MLSASSWEWVCLIITFSITCNYKIINLLIILSFCNWITRITKNSKLCIIFNLVKEAIGLAIHELLVFFRHVCFCHGSTLTFSIAMNTLLEPVGNEGSLAMSSFVIWVHLCRIMTEHFCYWEVYKRNLSN